MKKHHTLWALSYQFDFGRRLLGTLCWQGGVHDTIEIALFATRAKARAAQKTCCYRPTRVEKVSVTIKAVDAQRRGWKACRYLLVKLVADKDAEIERLRALVDKVPKTADDVAVMPGDEVWVRRNDGSVEPCRVQAVYRHKVSWGFVDLAGYEGAKLSVVYSTREAAEAAGGE